MTPVHRYTEGIIIDIDIIYCWWGHEIFSLPTREFCKKTIEKHLISMN